MLSSKPVIVFNILKASEEILSSSKWKINLSFVECVNLLRILFKTSKFGNNSKLLKKVSRNIFIDSHCRIFFVIIANCFAVVHLLLRKWMLAKCMCCCWEAGSVSIYRSIRHPVWLCARVSISSAIDWCYLPFLFFCSQCLQLFQFSNVKWWRFVKQPSTTDSIATVKYRHFQTFVHSLVRRNSTVAAVVRVICWFSIA